MAYYKIPNLLLKTGERGSDVKELQEDLLRLGYNVGKADGIFGQKTEKAVATFQSANLVTGTVNSETAAAIHSKAAGVAAATPLLDIPFIPSPNFSSRKGGEINLVVIHFTASGSLDTTVNWFENPTADASAHYIIARDGKIVRMVEEGDKAWHAGKSKWAGEVNCNKFSIGIEIVNWGILKKKDDGFYCWPGNYSKRYTGPKPVEAKGDFWETYTDEQYEALIPLTRGIIQRYGIPLKRIVGHSDIAPGRKVDPGPLFDWNRFKSSLAL